MEENMKRYGNALFKYCWGILCDFHDAQDAVQETFAKAHSARQTLLSQEAYAAWLYKIAYRTCLNIQRSKRRWLFFPPKEPVRETACHMDDPFSEPALMAALATLTPADRALFYSRAVEGMEYSQLEERFNIRAATLRKRYERAKNKLRAILEESK